MYSICTYFVLILKESFNKFHNGSKDGMMVYELMCFKL